MLYHMFKLQIVKFGLDCIIPDRMRILEEFQSCHKVALPVLKASKTSRSFFVVL